MRPLPFFSIIIPSFNAEDVIGNAIESILCQTYKDFEILVIDGLSTDNTVTILNRFQDPRLQVYCEKDNGIYDAMNKGIKKSQGSWLLFLGADDALYEEDTLRRIALMITKYPETRFVYGDVFTSGNYVRRYNKYNYYKLLHVCICHQSIIYHRSLFNDCLYDEAYKICADWDFNLKVFRNKNRPKYISRPLANFSLTGASQNWSKHPEYLQHFSNKRKLILKHRGIVYLGYYYFILGINTVLKKLKKKFRR